MGFDLLQRKQAAISELMTALNKIEAVLPELSDAEADALVVGIEDLVAKRNRLAHATKPGQKTLKPSSNGFPNPTDAVISLISAHPEGLKTKQIVQELLGKIATSAKKPDRIIYSTLFNLKNKKTIRKRDDGKYVMATS